MLPRAQLIRMIVAVLVITVAGSAFLLQFDWFGTAASEEAGPIDTLFDVMIVLSTLVFAVVMAMLFHSVYRYRAKPGDTSDGLPIHGNTRIEIVWTAIPTLIVVVAGVYSALVLADIEKRDPGRMVVKVKSQQFAWSFEYPKLRIKSNELYVPVGRQVEFQMQSVDVLHSFWVPAWRIKKDTVPGITTRGLVTPSRVGSYPVVCAELCGLGHSTMRARATVLSKQDFDAWVARQQGAAGGGGGGGGGGGAKASAAGKQLFQAQGCSSCHTLKAAGAKGTIGPDLDQNLSGKDAAYIRGSILDPDARLAKGFQAGIMPPTFGKDLSKKELETLVAFLLESTRR